MSENTLTKHQSDIVEFSIYSRVRNNRAGTLINLGEKSTQDMFIPATPFIRDAFPRKTILQCWKQVLMKTSLPHDKSYSVFEK